MIRAQHLKTSSSMGCVKVTSLGALRGFKARQGREREAGKSEMPLTIEVSASSLRELKQNRMRRSTLRSDALSSPGEFLGW